MIHLSGMKKYWKVCYGEIPNQAIHAKFWEHDEQNDPDGIKHKKEATSYAEELMKDPAIKWVRIERYWY